ncbi:MAG: hypothetical protein CTY16_17905 [Methylobacter sp.]|nr:MAG: hypothetical protein CTY16_17905 [Methylobacter sp.]
MKNFYLYSALFCTSLVFASTVAVAVPAVDNTGVAAIITCPTSATGAAIPATAYHSDKIVFAITDKLVAQNTADQIRLDAIPFNTPLDIKVKDDPRKVAHIKNKVLTFLGASTNPQLGNAAKIRIDSVLYAAVVCPKSP